MKKSKICSIFQICLSLLMIVGMKSFFGDCGPKDDGSFMACHWACRMTQISGLLLTVLSLISFLLKDSRVRGGIFLAEILIAVLTALIPGTIIPLCMMPQMHCRMWMQPFVRTMGAGMLAIAIAGALISGKEAQRE